MVPVTDLSAITNSQVSSVQLLALRQYDERQYADASTADAVRYTLAELTQSAGILLRLPQEVIAQAIVLLQRFMVVSADEEASNIAPKEASAAVLYLSAKLSFTPISPRSLLTVYQYLQSASSPLILLNTTPPSGSSPVDPKVHHLSEGNYETLRNRLYLNESVVLKAIAFDTHVALPYSLALTYLSVLGLSAHMTLAARVVAHLNAALLSPQLLYLTHQPNALAVAAIYLSAKEVEVKLVDGNWWEVFDVDREDLGFLVISLQGIAKLVREQVIEKWKGKVVPLG